MKHLDALRSARDARTPTSGHPASAILYDVPDARLVVFRVEPGQVVPLHRSASAVQLMVLEGQGRLTGEREEGTVDVTCQTGDIVMFAPNELHGVQADSETLVILATITPRPVYH